ncbi:MAG: matrixin family metalloprotease [Phycisphaerae bacterium]
MDTTRGRLMTVFNATAALTLTAMFAPTPVARSGAPRAGGAFVCSGSHARSGVCACYAPGTDPAYMDQFESDLETAYVPPPGASAYSLGGRWTQTALDGFVSGNGVPIQLTYSFPPDTNTGDPATSNTIHATLDAQFGSRAAWKNLFADIFNDWSVTTGITFTEASDDGAAWPSSAGAPGVRGDVRIVCFAVDGPNNVLAYNYFPNTGDMAIDKDENWANAANDYRFMRNILLHELGHGIGLRHVLPQNGTKLMEAYLNTTFAGPQDDDVRGANRYYGDGAEPNNSAAAAVDLAAFAGGTSTNALSLHGGDDVDVFAIALGAGQALTMQATPLGGSYSVGPDTGTPTPIDTRAVLPLKLEVYNATGTTLLGSQTASAAGQNVGVGPVPPQSGQAQVLVRISSTSATADVQRYGLFWSNGATTFRTLSVSTSGASGVLITCAPTDASGHNSATTPASLSYANGTSVTLTAPSTSGAKQFVRWTLDGVDGATGQRSTTFAMNADRAAMATYSDGPVVNAGGDRQIVAGESVALAAGVAGGTPPYTYAWTPSTGLSVASAANPIAAPTASTTYTVTVTDSAGATGSDSVAVAVIPGLVVAAGSDQTVGAGLTFTLSALASGGVGPYSYSWSPAGALATSSSATVSGAVSETTAFAVVATDGVGRTATDSVTVVVAPPLVASAGPDLTLLFGSSAELSADADGGLPPYGFTWLPTPGGVLASDGSTVRVDPRQTTVYTLTATDALGQTATDTVTVTVPPQLQVGVIAGVMVVESGEATTLDASVSGGVAPFTYEWTPTSGLTSPSAARTDARPTATTTYTLTVRDSAGQSAAASVRINVLEPEEEEFALSPAPIGLCGAGLVTALPVMVAGLVPMRRRRSSSLGALRLSSANGGARR